MVGDPIPLDSGLEDFMIENTKWILADRELPDSWMNLAADLEPGVPRPVLGEEERPADLTSLARLYSEECARIELLEGPYGQEPFISIPGEVLDAYKTYRATPLYRAICLERRLRYQGRIFYKREDGNPTGSHKPNTAIPQAFYASRESVRGLVTDTGAGQWGAALALACRRFGLVCSVFMTRNSYRDKPYRRYLMEMVGAKVFPSPSQVTECGRALLRQEGDHRGSLGIGMGEAVELVEKSPGSKLALGCMSYYAALHQTVVGQELSRQLECADCRPDVLVACVGGGTNLVGFMCPFLRDAVAGRECPEMIAAESSNVPVLTEGEYRYDYADYFGLTPKILMYTLGHETVPPEMHAGGLRYHGKSPILSLLVRQGHVRPVAIPQEEALEAGRFFFETEGVLPAPESSHAIAATFRAVRRAQEEGLSKDIVFCLSGTGFLDLEGYARVLGLD
jgi:tryptophan synthase beta chain